MFENKNMNYKTVQISKFLHHKIRVLVAREDDTITEFVERACRKELKRRIQITEKGGTR